MGEPAVSTLDDTVWGLLPARAPGRMHTAIVAEITTTHPETTSADVIAALRRLKTAGRVRSTTRKGQTRWVRNQPHPAQEPETKTLF